MELSGPVRRAFANDLLRWYARHKRALPWRDSPDPYKVWVSEALLQQTRVEQAEPYYGRFLQRFPTVRALADAPLEDVLKAWEGLGYYARARNLHAAAKTIVREHAGRLPSDEQTLAKLPGFGPYTTNAVLSLAFNQDKAVCDGNVARVLARVLVIGENVREPRTRARIQTLAQELLSKGRARDFNQALMDLGSMVCTPRGPKCVECPLARACRAHQAGCEEEYPRRSRSAPKRVERAVALVARRGGEVLLVRRPEQGLLGGLWSLPQQGIASDSTRAARQLARGLGLKEEVTRAGRVRHAYSHFTLELEVFRVEGLAPGPWRRPSAVALDGATRKALALVKR